MSQWMGLLVCRAGSGGRGLLLIRMMGLVVGGGLRDGRLDERS